MFLPMQATPSSLRVPIVGHRHRCASIPTRLTDACCDRPLPVGDADWTPVTVVGLRAIGLQHTRRRQRGHHVNRTSEADRMLGVTYGIAPSMR